MGFANKVYVYILSLFFLLFVTTLLAVGKIWPFENIEKEYTDKLFKGVLLELAVVVFIIFQALPRIHSTTISQFELFVTYVDYCAEYINLLSETKKKCLDPSFAAENRTECEEVLSELSAIRQNVQKCGQGRVYLTIDGRSNLISGFVNYHWRRTGITCVNSQGTMMAVGTTYLE